MILIHLQQFQASLLLLGYSALFHPVLIVNKGRGRRSENIAATSLATFATTN
jgi:hypothetical protein